ncbi:chaplin [Streptomyces wuyuanensis]|uniref:Small secreted domain n=1 Tax=Streptomyces wuyuanensis TaxID=1196353 RepID=A0A1H0A5L9_9ACTN|nr:chaplin [Streptomyces wuyuanensis]SDN28868.1 Small secreted domain [Streptomyces wuyuanensis]
MRMRIASTVAALAVAGVLVGAGGAVADSGAEAAAVGSPGVLSGNVIQVPLHVPLNLCGNSLGVVSLLNPAVGNACLNG